VGRWIAMNGFRKLCIHTVVSYSSILTSCPEDNAGKSDEQVAITSKNSVLPLRFPLWANGGSIPDG
jgi:hypothetical protein